jgi:hypothetical protein
MIRPLALKMNLFHAEAQRRREENATKDFCKRLHEWNSQGTIKISLAMPNAPCPIFKAGLLFVPTYLTNF